VVVLDTPPTANALDFLRAPDRILDVLDNNAMRVVLGPLLKASRIGLKLFALPTGLVLRTLAKFTGQDFLRDLAHFMVAFEGMYEGFKERAGKVKRLLSGPETGFVLVTGPNPLTIEEALFFHRALHEEGISTAAVVVNRVQRDPHRFGGPDSAPALREALQLAQIPDGGGPPLSQRLARTLAEQATLADLDRRQVLELSHTLSGVPLFVVPQLRKDVHDLGGLWQIDECLSAAEE
jgi:anion-transporting  ArsA/GET3 family ATPase